MGQISDFLFFSSSRFGEIFGLGESKKFLSSIFFALSKGDKNILGLKVFSEGIILQLQTNLSTLLKT